MSAHRRFVAALAFGALAAAPFALSAQEGPSVRRDVPGWRLAQADRAYAAIGQLRATLGGR